MAVLKQIIISDEYGFLQDLSDFFPRTILDAGANIGMATVLFALRYPNATIVAVEPNHANFEVLKSNTQRFGNVKIEKHGLWSKSASLSISKVDDSTRKGHWAFEVKESSSTESDLHGVSVELLLVKHGLPSFDMLKVSCLSPLEFDTKSPNN